MWNLTGECVKVIEGHKGRGIWSMCVNKNDNKVVRSCSNKDVSTDMFCDRSREELMVALEPVALQHCKWVGLII